MNDELQDELNEPIPQLTEDAIASMEQFNQEAAYSANINPVEDQGQVDGQQTSQQTGSTELKTPQSDQAPDYSEINKKREAGEKVTFKEGFLKALVLHLDTIQQTI